MTLYTAFADIPRAALSDPTVLGHYPLEAHVRITEWMFYNTADEKLPLTAIPVEWDRQEVSDTLWDQGVSTWDGVLTAEGDRRVRAGGVLLIRRLHDGDLTSAQVRTLLKSDDFAQRVVGWCELHDFVRHDFDTDTVSLYGVLKRLNEWVPPAPSPAKSPATVPEHVTPPPAQSPAKSPAPVPAKSPVHTPATVPVNTPKHVTPSAQPPAPAPSLDLIPLVGRMVKALEILADNTGIRPTPVVPPNASPIMDCARELAILLDKMQPASVNTLRERVRARLRPHTRAALELGVKRGAFQLIGSARRGGEYSLIDPVPLDLTWGHVRAESARRKPARQLAGARGT